MASPQLENGYTKIANEIMEAFARTRIPGEAMQLLMAILRKTYGFNKKEDAISLSQFHQMTSIQKPHIIRGINILVDMNIIAKKGNGDSVEYRFNKDFDTWKPLPKKVTLPKKAMSVAQKGNESLPKKVPTKETITKEIVQKKSIIAGNPPHHELMNLWNTICGETLGRITQLSDQRKKHIAARWNEHADLSFWQSVFEKLLTADHCLGKSDGGWKASFDFIIKNNNGYTKLMDGCYDNAIRKGGAQQDINARHGVSKIEEFQGGTIRL